jgi:hypothetical protein
VFSFLNGNGADPTEIARIVTEAALGACQTTITDEAKLFETVISSLV